MMPPRSQTMPLAPARHRAVYTGSLAVAALLGLAACSSDAAPAPEPRIEQPGSFILADEPVGGLTLYRNIGLLELPGDFIISLRTYDVRPRGVDDARALSQEAGLPVRQLQTAASLRKWPSGPHWVVWYRSLNPGEEAQ